ncbi:MAG: RnfABCDGE type electron transport complex subunit D [Candidatus Aenigmarchaeota archaeon]|nr:RnfABCDGE type electron transport complex subunit D [Candidatus Aenigmarchaeota archaeon]
MIVALSALAAFSIYTSGISTITHFAIIIGIATALDIFINYFLYKEKPMPKSAIITGFIIALILAPSSALWAQVGIPLFAIASKHIIKWKKVNVFNPAALALLIGGFVGALPSWWAVSPLVWPLGIFISWKMRKLEISLSFLAAYFILFTALGRIDPGMEVMGSAAMFLAFFMATEPKTTPSSGNGKIIFGILLAILSLGIAMVVPAVDFLLGALLISNIFKNHLNAVKFAFFGNKLFL